MGLFRVMGPAWRDGPVLTRARHERIGHMRENLRTILDALRSQLPELRAEYAVESLAVFGSIVRDEAGPESDIDLLVTFAQSPSLFRVVALQDHLTNLLGRRVDLVMKTALKPRLRDRVLREAVAA